MLICRGGAITGLCCCSAPPLDLVAVVRRRLAHPGTVLGGFRTIIDGSDGRPLRFMTWHHLVKVRRNRRKLLACSCRRHHCIGLGDPALVLELVVAVIGLTRLAGLD